MAWKKILLDGLFYYTTNQSGETIPQSILDGRRVFSDPNYVELLENCFCMAIGLSDSKILKVLFLAHITPLGEEEIHIFQVTDASPSMVREYYRQPSRTRH